MEFDRRSHVLMLTLSLFLDFSFLFALYKDFYFGRLCDYSLGLKELNN